MTTKPFPAGSVNTTELSASKSLSDVLHAVDSRSRAVLAAEEFAADICRLEIMKGEYEQQARNILAQQDKVLESRRLADETMQAEIKRVTNGEQK